MNNRKCDLETAALADVVVGDKLFYGSRHYGDKTDMPMKVVTVEAVTNKQFMTDKDRTDDDV